MDDPTNDQSGRDTADEARDPPIDEVAQARAFEALFQRAAAPGKLERYVVLGTLGRGGMGTVLRAHDRELDRQVALKVLRRDLDQHHTIRLRREAQAMAKLSHPNVVQVYEVGELEGQTFVAMELVKGLTLEAWMRQEPRPGWRACVNMFMQLGAGLAAAHEQGLVHRDFKPGNAIVDQKNRPRVLDFGLARQADEGEGEGEGEGEPRSPSEREHTAEHEPVALEGSITQTGTVLGTPAYMPPEQMAGRQADARSDQFSFCVSLFEAVYGERPYEGTSMMGLMVSMRSGAVRPPPKRSTVPATLRKVLLRGLAIEPAQRWPSMGALIDALRAQAAPRRGRRLVLGVTVGLLAIGGGGVWADRVFEWANRCTGGRAQLHGIWDDARRQEAETAILGTELSYAPGTWERVEHLLDEYTEAWVNAYTEVCEATAVRGEQTNEVQALRMGCLHQQRSHVRATVDVLARADATVVENAVVAVESLPRLSRCADVEALEAEVPPPEDPAVAERVEQLDEQLIEAQAHDNAGSYAEGLAVAEAVVAEAKALEYEPLMARAWLRQGKLQHHAGDYEGAVTTLRQAYDAAVARRMTAEAADASQMLMSVLSNKLARQEEARRWAVDADPLSRAVGDDARSRYLDVLGSTARLEGKLDEARDFHQRARALFEKAFGPGSPDGTSLSNLGNVAYLQGKLDEARDFYQRALAIREQALGPGHPDVARSFSNLGAVTASQGKLDDARDFHQRALTIFEKALGPEHPDVARSFGNLGIVAQRQGKLDDARDFHQRALALSIKALGPEHPHVAYSLNSLGTVADLQGKLDDARDFHQRALAIREQAFGPEHHYVAGSLNNLGVVAERQGKLDEARDFHQRALAIWTKALGPEHPNVADALTNLGVVAQRQGKLDEALQFHQRALAIFDTTLGPEHPDVASSLNNLGDILLGLAEPAEALPLLERALAICTTQEVDPTDLAETRFMLAHALWTAPATQGRDRPRAHVLVEQARDALAAAEGSDEAIAEAKVEAWLAKHPLP